MLCRFRDLRSVRFMRRRTTWFESAGLTKQIVKRNHLITVNHTHFRYLNSNKLSTLPVGLFDKNTALDAL